MQALAARAGIRTDGGTAETARQVAQYIGSAARYSLDTPVQPRDEDFVLQDVYKRQDWTISSTARALR